MVAYTPGDTILDLPPAAWASTAAVAGGAGRSSGALDGAEGLDGDAGGGVPLDLPRCAQLLLLAAFIASRNKATTDKAMFELGARAGRTKKGGMAADRQVCTSSWLLQSNND